MNDPVFWQLGFVVLQEALLATVAVIAVVSLLRGLFNGLDRACHTAKRMALASQAAPVAHVMTVPAPVLQKAATH